MEQAMQPMFDVDRGISIKLITPDGEKTVEMRFPTDEEWIALGRQKRITVKRHTDGSSETTIPDSEASDLELALAIRQGEAPELDAAEAQHILERLRRSEVGDIVREGAGYAITLSVPGAETLHRLRVPSHAELMKYRRASGSLRETRRGIREIRVDISASRELYKKLCIETQGYVGAVPIVHQVAAVEALIEEMNYAVSGDGQGNF